MTRKLTMLTLSAFTLLAGLATSSMAQTVTNPVSLVGGFGYGRGGDTIVVGTYTDGSVTNIKAGNGLDLFLGGAYRLNEKLAVQADAGYQSSTGSAVNGELTFKRLPVEVLGYFYLDKSWRMGLGARFDEHVKLSGTGVASAVQHNFNSAVGGMAEIEYLISPEVGIKFRGIKEKFKPNGYDITFNGNQAAILVSLYYF